MFVISASNKNAGWGASFAPLLPSIARAHNLRLWILPSKLLSINSHDPCLVGQTDLEIAPSLPRPCYICHTSYLLCNKLTLTTFFDFLLWDILSPNQFFQLDLNCNFKKQIVENINFFWSLAYFVFMIILLDTNFDSMLYRMTLLQTIAFENVYNSLKIKQTTHCLSQSSYLLLNKLPLSRIFLVVASVFRWDIVRTVLGMQSR